jgi:hypothetical protein
LVPSSALLAGVVAGVGLWLTVEYLLTLAAVFAALTMAWVVLGRDFARKNLWFAAGLLGSIAVALLVERPLPEAFMVEYDRISVVQFTIGVLALVFWLAVCRIEVLGYATSNVRSRLLVATLGGALAFALVYLIHPGLFLGVEASMDPRLRPILLDHIAEMQGMAPVDAEGLANFVVFLSPSLPCVPFVVYVIARERGRPGWEAWIYLAIALAIFLPFALAAARFVAFAEILLVIIMSELLVRMLDWIREHVLIGLRVLLWSASLLVFLFGSMVLLPIILPNPQQAYVGICDLRAMADFLNRADGLNDRPRSILTEPSFGPELLYRTRHAVIGTPYHRNTQGIIDNHRLFNVAYHDADRALIDQRGIDLILQCRARDGRYVPVDKTDSFYDRLLAGDHPEWLRPISLPDDLDPQFRLYEVRRP